MARNYPLEQLFGPLFRGMPRTIATSAANQFAGRTTIDSGSATVTVSTNAVEADSIISLALQIGVASLGIAVPCVVKSINPGNHMILGWADNTAVTRDVTIMWRIVGQ